MKRVSLILVFLFSVSHHLLAQTLIKGSVNGADNKPAVAANVLLLRSTDSSLVKGTVTGKTGEFSFENIAAGQYQLMISFAGHDDIRSQPVIADKTSIELGVFQLKPASVQLEKVTVTSRKPLFEQKIDRMVVNVRNSITAAGSSVLEVLEKSPGIVVNRQNSAISMNGKDGVVVMINGRISRMPMSALVQMLAGMNASNIEKIELITTPPANFDAEGNAGFINIVMVSNPNQGLNGSYSLTMGYGRGETPAAGINFNYRHGKINLYGDYSFSRLHTDQLFTNYRWVNYQGDITENYVESNRNTFQRNHNLNLGIDYELSKKTTVGLLFAAYDNKWSMDAKNDYTKTLNGQLDTTINIYNDEVNHWRHSMADINLQHRFKEDQTLSFDLNYLWYHDNNPTDYVNEYYDAQGDYLFSELTKSTKLTPIHFWVGTADYAMRLGKKWNMQSGLKFTLSRFTNDVGVERYLQNNWVKDTELTGKYKLKEDIGAAYLSFNGDPSEKTSIKLGLRYEYTTSNLGTVAIPNIVDRKYGRLFPSFFISHKLNDDNSMNFSYSRRINRPTFNEMAPFVIFMDPYTFFAGNAAIQPSITNTLKADYLLKNFVFSLSYAMEAGTISRFQVDVDVANNKQYFRAQNLDKTNSLTASFSLPFNFTKWWSMQANIIGTWEKISASYKNDPVNIDIASFNAFASQTFKLPKNYTLELSGFYQSPGLFGIARFEGLGRMDFGAQKKIGTKGGSLRFSITDVFQSMLIKISSDMKDQGFYTNSTIRFNYRTFRLTWTCPFGNKELKGKRNRATGSEEERSRVSQQ